MRGLWEKLSAKVKAGELEEISHTVGKKLVDSNRDIWSEFEALLDIFCENGNHGRKEIIFRELEEKLAEFSGDDVVRNCMFTQNFCLKPIFRSVCEDTKNILLHENMVLEDQRGELEMELFASLDTPKSTPSTSVSSTPVKTKITPAMAVDTVESNRDSLNDRSLKSPTKSTSSTCNQSLSNGIQRLNVSAAALCLNCSKCGGSKKNCSECLMLLKSAGFSAGSSGVVGSIKQQVAAARLLGKEKEGEKLKVGRGGGNSQSGSASGSASASASASDIMRMSMGGTSSRVPVTTVRNMSPLREAKSAPPSSKLRSKLQSARDEKHFCDDNDII